MLHTAGTDFVHRAYVSLKFSRKTANINVKNCHFWATVCKTIRPMLSDRRPVCPLCNVDMLWPNGWKDQDETWHAGRPRPRLPRVTYGDPAPPRKEAQQPPPTSAVYGRRPVSIVQNGWMD